MRRRARLRPRSAKRRADAERRAVVYLRALERDRGCLLRALPGHECLGPLTPHHLRKASQGGAFEPENIVTLCALGNDEVEDHPAQAIEMGLVVNRFCDAEEAARRRRAWGLS